MAELQENKIGRIFMPHGIGHFLGLDVHDTSIYPKVQ
jgi:Xaa-Pro dipeptidase